MRVSEVYTSVQGEGPNVGKTTVFVRFGGCNLRCPGWPCDTQHAIDPAYRNEWKREGAEDLASTIYTHMRMGGTRLITLTGGEPFLQVNYELEELLEELPVDIQVEAFTNGTLIYPEWATESIHMIMDWKLPGSGEDPYNPIRIENLERLDQSSLLHSIKFVCKDMDDMLKAHALWSSHLGDRPYSLETFYGRVWNADVTNAELAEYVMKNQLPWRMNVQMHNYVWDPQERGR